MSNDLIVRKDNFFEKIKRFFKKIFFKKYEVLNEDAEMSLVQKLNNEKLKNKQLEEEKYAKEKEKIVKLYQDLINEKTSPYNIPEEYLEKIKLILNDDIHSLDKDIDNMKKEYGYLKYKIESYQ